MKIKPGKLGARYRVCIGLQIGQRVSLCRPCTALADARHGSARVTLVLYRRRAFAKESRWAGRSGARSIQPFEGNPGVCGGRGPMGFESTFACNR